MNNKCDIFVIISMHTRGCSIHANPFIFNIIFCYKFIKCF